MERPLHSLPHAAVSVTGMGARLGVRDRMRTLELPRPKLWGSPFRQSQSKVQRSAMHYRIEKQG